MLWLYCKYAKRSSKYFTILPILFDCETRSLTLTEEHRLIMFEDRVSGPDKEASEKDRENHIIRKFIIYIVLLILLG